MILFLNIWLLVLAVAILAHQVSINDYEVEIRELKERLDRLERGTLTALNDEKPNETGG